MARLNYHHLFYFWQVAKGEGLTHVAKQLHLSQSALSMQIKQLEEMMGHKLFTREGRKLNLTEAGHVALNYAEEIFTKGEELTALMKNQEKDARQQLRIGLVATLSRNFVDSFIGPLLSQPNLYLSLRSLGKEGLLSELANHQLDLVLSNAPVRAERNLPWRCRQIAQQTVSIVGHTSMQQHYKGPKSLEEFPIIVPGPYSEIRTGFELQCEHWGIKPNIVAEVDDMAMMRLVARDSQALAIIPAIAVKDEISSGKLQIISHLKDVVERFYAISIQRQFENPIITKLMAQEAGEILGV
jgi:LysR family transcriptional activator of nhaA